MKILLVLAPLLLAACSTTPVQHQPFRLTDNACPPPAKSMTESEKLLICSDVRFQPASYNSRPLARKKLRLSDRGTNIYMGAGVAALNNPENPSGDVDNISVAVGGKMAVMDLSFRPEAQLGERSKSFNTSVTHDFNIAGNGLGAIDGNVGLGYSMNTGNENNVLGNSDSAFLRIGAEGYLAGDIMTGIALMVAPWGYNGEETAIAGMGYFGVAF